MFSMFGWSHREAETYQKHPSHTSFVSMTAEVARPQPNRSTAEPDGSDAEPGWKRSRPMYRCIDKPTDEHAVALLEHLQEEECGIDHMLRYREIRKIYDELIVRLGWHPRPWNSVSRQFDLLTTGGKKPLAYLPDDEGRFIRVRYYPVPRRQTELQVVRAA